MDQARAWYLEQKIRSAEPLALICMLYESALQCVRTAREMLRCGDVLARSKAISKASEALGLLACSLNLDVGGQLGRDLLELYLYMQKRLLDANIEQSDKALSEVQHLLVTLQSSWAQLAQGDSRLTSAQPD